jgi:hypothetical protein
MSARDPFPPQGGFDPWDVTDRKLTLGYVDPAGEWVPGILENIRNLAKAHDIAEKRMDRYDKQQSAEMRWLMRIVCLTVLVRFFGIESITSLMHLFTGAH